MTIIKKTLQDIVLAVKRGLSSYYLKEEGDKVQFINIRNIENGRVNSSKVSTFRVKDTGALEKTRIEPNDVIMSVIGPVFKTAIADESVKGYLISSNLIAFKLNQEILPEIVVAYLNSPKGQRELKARSAGAAQTVLNLKSLIGIRIPIPDKNKQKVLAEYLTLSNEHNAIIRREREIRRKLKTGMIQNYMMR